MNNPERTTITATVATADVPRIVELLLAEQIPANDIETYAAPTDPQATVPTAESMQDQYSSDRTWTPAFELTPHEFKPITFVREVATGEVTEVITIENLRDVSRDLYGTTHSGTSLASAIFGSMFRQRYRGNRQDFIGTYLFGYRPKKVSYQALRRDKAPQLLAEYERGEVPIPINSKGHQLLAHVCTLIEVEPEEIT